MSNYIKSELYRVLHNKGTYLFMAICSLLLVSANVLLAVVKLIEHTGPYATTKFSFSNVYTNMILVLFLCIIVTLMIFCNENNNHTMKNTISYGISRGTIYFGKFIIQVVYAFVAFLVILSIEVISAYLLLADSGIKELEMLLRASLLCFPLFLTALAVTNCFAFCIEGIGGAIGSTFGILLGIPLVASMLGMKFEIIQKFADRLPYNMIFSLKYNFEQHSIHTVWGTNKGLTYYWMIGVAQMVLFCLIGYLLFRKREVK